MISYFSLTEFGLVSLAVQVEEVLLYVCDTSDPSEARIAHQFNTLVQVSLLPEEVQHTDPALGSQEQPYEALLLCGMQPAIFIPLCCSEAYGIS